MRSVSKCGLLAAACLPAALCLSPTAARTDAARAVQSAPPTQTAAALYAKHCATCHGKDGRAKTLKAKFNGARDLTDAAWHEGATDERIFNSIANGRGKKMPAFGKKLSTAETESLVAFVRELKRGPRRAVGDRRAPE